MPIEGTDFVDTDLRQPGGYSPRPATPASPAAASQAGRAPTREELDGQLTATQQEITRLKEAQEQLERAKAAVEEMRRRRAEYHNGRDEMLQNLPRAVGLLEQAELNLRRDAVQMGKTLESLRAALANVQSINDKAWTDTTWETEIGRALATIESARMEWTQARLAWPVVDGKSPAAPADDTAPKPATDSLAGLSVGQLAKLGFAFNWPVVVLGALVLVLTVVLAAKR